MTSEPMTAISLLMFAKPDRVEWVTDTLHAIAVGMESTVEGHSVEYFRPISMDEVDEMLVEAIVFHGLGWDEDDDRNDPHVVALRGLRERARELVVAARREEEQLEAEWRTKRVQRDLEIDAHVRRLLSDAEEQGQHADRAIDDREDSDADRPAY